MWRTYVWDGCNGVNVVRVSNGKSEVYVGLLPEQVAELLGVPGAQVVFGSPDEDIFRQLAPDVSQQLDRDAIEFTLRQLRVVAVPEAQMRRRLSQLQETLRRLDAADGPLVVNRQALDQALAQRDYAAALVAKRNLDAAMKHRSNVVREARWITAEL